ncbi:MAG: hypothetical protein ACJATI_004614 [Halioglobus sp.]
MIFGGSSLDAQRGKGGVDDEKTKSPIFDIFGDKKDDGGGGDFSCREEDENGQFCFTQQVYFVNLEFEDEIDPETGIREAILPCDLHVGVSIEGLDEITFISLSDNIYYNYVEATATDTDFESFFWGPIKICFDANDIYDLLNYNPNISCNDADPFTEAIIGEISISFDIYCKDPLGGMTPVDNCDSGFDFLEDYTYGGDLYDECSFEIIQDYEICCKSLKKGLDESEEIKTRVSFQDSELSVAGSKLNDIHYNIYSINGILHSSGKIDNTDTKHHTIRDLNLENGIYILVLMSEGAQSSHKFVSFR